MQIEMSLCFVQKPDCVLLGLMQRGPFRNHWNGHGGKLEPEDEGDLEKCAQREVLQESGLTVNNLEHMGEIYFSFTHHDKVAHVTIYRTSMFSGMLKKTTPEMHNEWYRVQSIPYDSMMPFDREWLPLVLEGKKVSGSCLFEQVGERYKIIEKKLEVK